MFEIIRICVDPKDKKINFRKTFFIYNALELDKTRLSQIIDDQKRTLVVADVFLSEIHQNRNFKTIRNVSYDQ